MFLLKAVNTELIKQFSALPKTIKSVGEVLISAIKLHCCHFQQFITKYIIVFVSGENNIQHNIIIRIIYSANAHNALTIN